MTGPPARAVAPDPVQFEVIRNALLEAAEEMAITLRRSAYSTNIKTRADFSCAVFDPDLRVVAQAFAQPNHLGSLTELVPRAVSAYGPERLGPGDALITNHPYLGGVHLNDITLISPVHQGGALVGYVASLAHHVDVGGGAPASIGAFREVFQEGVIIPPVRLVAGGRIVDDVFRLILAQVRAQEETPGDLRAQIAANTTGARRLGDLLARYGAATVRDYVDALIAYTDRRTAAAIARLPRGAFAAEAHLDSDGYGGPPVRLAARITLDDDGVLFDLTGSDPQRRAPVNSTYAQTFAACAYVLKCLLDPDIPTNAGFYRHVRLIAPEGTVVNCTAPAPVVAGWETHMRLTDLLLLALSEPLPERVPAGTKGMICHAGFGGQRAGGAYYCFLETLAGGYGGRLGLDGPDAVQTHGQNTENAPVEETEAGYPVRIARYELVEDSEGAGRWRGGLGLRRDYQFPGHAVTFTVLADRDREGPWGLFGGLPGRPAAYLLNPDGEARALSAKGTVELRPGDTVSYRTCGGGGYGPPYERDPRLVLADVRDGKVSAARAREVYGVAVDSATWTVDEAETARLRGGP
jgi:N-methylhydantoinase B